MGLVNAMALKITSNKGFGLLEVDGKERHVYPLHKTYGIDDLKRIIKD